MCFMTRIIIFACSSLFAGVLTVQAQSLLDIHFQGPAIDIPTQQESESVLSPSDAAVKILSDSVKHLNEQIPSNTTKEDNGQANPVPVEETAIAAKASDFSADRTLNPTIYYLPRYTIEPQKCNGATMEVKNTQVITIANICVPQYKSCLLQGTCILDDPTNDTHFMINYIDTLKKNGAAVKSNGMNVALFAVVDMGSCPFGQGVLKSCLDPYYSIAAHIDASGKGPLPFGTVIYVPKVKGTLLPNGTVHPGYFIVTDRGYGIQNGALPRFDFFTGIYHFTDPKNPFTKLGLSDPKNSIIFKVVTGTTAEQFRKSRNFPKGLSATKSIPLSKSMIQNESAMEAEDLQDQENSHE